MVETAAPPGYRFRRPTSGDLEETHRVLCEIQETDFGEADFTLEKMAAAWKLTDPKNMWIAEDEGGRIVAFATIRVRHPTRLRVFAGVVPEHRGKGLGARLLQVIEERGRELAAEAPAGEDVYIGQDIGWGNTDGGPLLERYGYEQERTFWKMGIDLTEEPPQQEVPEGISLEGMRPGTERELFDASEEAFQDHWDHKPHDYDEWRAWMIERDTFDPSLWLVAYDGDEIAGMSMNYVDPGEAWVGVLAVRRPWRRRGLGLALLCASFREFWKRGVPKASLGVDAQNPTGATRLYERAGMHVVYESN